MNYEEIADQVGLRDRRKSLYVSYMRARWGAQESTQCATGYAHEWATRFARGIEYLASDLQGQRVLDKLNGAR